MACSNPNEFPSPVAPCPWGPVTWHTAEQTYKKQREAEQNSSGKKHIPPTASSGLMIGTCSSFQARSVCRSPHGTAIISKHLPTHPSFPLSPILQALSKREKQRASLPPSPSLHPSVPGHDALSRLLLLIYSLSSCTFANKQVEVVSEIARKKTRGMHLN